MAPVRGRRSSGGDPEAASRDAMTSDPTAMPSPDIGPVWIDRGPGPRASRGRASAANSAPPDQARSRTLSIASLLTTAVSTV
jgi:hypothetical protein